MCVDGRKKLLAEAKLLLERDVMGVRDFTVAGIEFVIIDVTEPEVGLAVLMGKMLIRWGEVCVFKACVRACGAIGLGLGRAIGEASGTGDDRRIADGRTVELAEETRKGWERVEDLVRGMVKELMQ